MGAAEARMFAREGARVVIGDVLETEGRAVESDIAAKGGEVVFVRLDVTSEAEWQAAVGLAARRFGALVMVSLRMSSCAFSKARRLALEMRGS